MSDCMLLQETSNSTLEVVHPEIQTAGKAAGVNEHGDFNANVIFDKPSRRYKFRDFVGELEADGIQSLYHEQCVCEHG